MNIKYIVITKAIAEKRFTVYIDIYEPEEKIIHLSSFPKFSTNSVRDAIRKIKKRFVVKKVTRDIKCQTACGNDYSLFVNVKVYEMISIKDKNVESN